MAARRAGRTRSEANKKNGVDKKQNKKQTTKKKKKQKTRGHVVTEADGVKGVIVGVWVKTMEFWAEITQLEKAEGFA